MAFPERETSLSFQTPERVDIDEVPHRQTTEGWRGDVADGFQPCESTPQGMGVQLGALNEIARWRRLVARWYRH